MIALNAHYDGKVIVPDEPLALEPNQQVRITVEPIASADSGEPKPKREFGPQPDAFLHVAPDFDAPLPDEFWGLEDKK